VSPGDESLVMQDPLMSQGYDIWTPTLRIARPTDSIEALLPFYVDGLGFQVLSRFNDHQGFSGVVLGHPGQAYHLEFTHHYGHKVGRAPSPDNLLVFYLPQRLAYQAAIGAMVGAGFKPVPSTNPYWEQHGSTFEDPDGYRVVLANKNWDR
jgi:catechol 2,3-dioxygenase-like lactoylglutathione lyase family enzyme